MGENKNKNIINYFCTGKEFFAKIDLLKTVL